MKDLEAKELQVTRNGENPSGCHGTALVGGFRITSYNLELREGDGFLGDTASVRAFLKMVKARRHELAAAGPSPFDDDDALNPEHFDAILASGTDRQKDIAEDIMRDYVDRLTTAIEAHLAQEAWQGVSRIVVGGGFEHTRAGQIAISRAGAALLSRDTPVDLQFIRHHPDEAGLIGCIHLAPQRVIQDERAILACDIGGTNFRCGIVSRAANEAESEKVWISDKWQHGGRDQPRDEALDHLASMLHRLADKAERSSLRLAPFVGIACPGLIQPDGRIERGAQNLPGDWEDPAFNLARLLSDKLARLGKGSAPEVCIHNDAVAQGLSEAPFMREIASWAVVTIGTGFGNASFQREPR